MGRASNLNRVDFTEQRGAIVSLIFLLLGYFFLIVFVCTWYFRSSFNHMVCAINEIQFPTVPKVKKKVYLTFSAPTEIQ